MHGITAEEIAGTPFPSFHAPSEHEHVQHHILEADRVGQVRYETLMIRNDGTVFPVQMDLVSARDADESLLYRVATLQDITARKEAENNRAAMEAQLRQAQKMEALDTLAGGIAHDFNNILGIIIGYTELALSDSSEKAPMMVGLQEVLKAAGRAKDLVRQILAFSRLSEQEKKPVQAGLIVNEAMKMLRASLPSTIEIKLN